MSSSASIVGALIGQETYIYPSGQRQERISIEARAQPGLALQCSLVHRRRELQLCARLPIPDIRVTLRSDQRRIVKPHAIKRPPIEDFLEGPISARWGIHCTQGPDVRNVA